MSVTIRASLLTLIVSSALACVGNSNGGNGGGTGGGNAGGSAGGSGGGSAGGSLATGSCTATLSGAATGTYACSAYGSNEHPEGGFVISLLNTGQPITPTASFVTFAPTAEDYTQATALDANFSYGGYLLFEDEFGHSSGSFDLNITNFGTPLLPGGTRLINPQGSAVLHLVGDNAEPAGTTVTVNITFTGSGYLVPCPDAPACGLVGAYCSGNSCCSGVCSQGICACTAEGQTCQQNSQCCSAVCSNGSCSPGENNGSLCTVNANCLSGNCASGVCADIAQCAQ